MVGAGSCGACHSVADAAKFGAAHWRGGIGEGRRRRWRHGAVMSAWSPAQGFGVLQVVIGGAGGDHSHADENSNAPGLAHAWHKACSARQTRRTSGHQEPAAKVRVTRVVVAADKSMARPAILSRAHRPSSALLHAWRAFREQPRATLTSNADCGSQRMRKQRSCRHHVWSTCMRLTFERTCTCGWRRGNRKV